MGFAGKAFYFNDFDLLLDTIDEENRWDSGFACYLKGVETCKLEVRAKETTHIRIYD